MVDFKLGNSISRLDLLYQGNFSPENGSSFHRSKRFEVFYTEAIGKVE